MKTFTDYLLESKTNYKDDQKIIDSTYKQIVKSFNNDKEVLKFLDFVRSYVDDKYKEMNQKDKTSLYAKLASSAISKGT